MKHVCSVVLSLALALSFCTLCTAAENQSAVFTDANFLAAVYEELGKSPGDPLTKAECEEVTMLDASDRGIKSLNGVELLVNLTDLWVAENQLTRLDFSKNPALEYLACYDNQLTSLNVRSNPKLNCLECEDNRLTSLDLTKNRQLVALDCSRNQLRDIDLKHNPELTYLYCSENLWRLLDVSKNPTLEELNNNLNGAVYGFDFREPLAYSGMVFWWMETPVWLQWALRHLFFGWVWMGYL